ncbi:hypothetical protein LCGC14_2380830 [marine sediment metagenome]|uniref:Uncharacterized protein n=1 Tax=marine sediment metagenome TaxID=412755 RepID=A0A0F9C101_9ZZZZ
MALFLIEVGEGHLVRKEDQSIDVSNFAHSHNLEEDAVIRKFKDIDTLKEFDRGELIRKITAIMG